VLTKFKIGVVRMREIKFRAWETDRKRWKMHFSISKSGVIIDEPATTILMQYIGCKDKNGEEIYEGDIIKDHKYPIYDFI
jgi:hypothetical protein